MANEAESSNSCALDLIFFGLIQSKAIFRYFLVFLSILWSCDVQTFEVSMLQDLRQHLEHPNASEPRIGRQNQKTWMNVYTARISV